MADERSLSKLRESKDRLKESLKGARKKLADARDGAEEANKKASKVPPYLLPVLGGAVGYAVGHADAMVRTPDVKTPVTIAVGGAAWLGSGVAAYFGQPTWATLAGTTAACSAAIVSHGAGMERGANMAARG
jgi:hypothetical protein